MKKQIYHLKLIRLLISGLMICLCVSITRAQDLPSCWENTDIGDVAITGDAYFEDDVFTISGSGADIYGTVDAFHFAYQPALDDCEISAYIAYTQPTAPDAKACVMIRETLEAGSAFAMAVACPGPGRGTYFQYRTVTDGEAGNTNLLFGRHSPVWVKLKRAGNTFTASYSDDGITWNEAAPTEIVMAGDVYIGLGVCAHAADSICESIFESVEVDPGIECETAINELSSNGLSVYPNPVSDKLKLNLNNNDTGNKYLTIFNTMGEVVIKETLSDNEHILDLKALPSGVYLITVISEQGTISRKIIKN